MFLRLCYRGRGAANSASVLTSAALKCLDFECYDVGLQGRAKIDITVTADLALTCLAVSLYDLVVSY